MCHIPFLYVKDERMKVEVCTTTVDRFKMIYHFAKSIFEQQGRSRIMHTGEGVGVGVVAAEHALE